MRMVVVLQCKACRGYFRNTLGIATLGTLWEYLRNLLYYCGGWCCSVKSAAARQYASTNASGAIVESARGLPSASTTASVTDARCSDSQWLVLMCVISVYWDALALGVYSYAPCADCLPECNVCVLEERESLTVCV